MSRLEPKAEVMVDYPYQQTQPSIRNARALDWSEVVKLLTNPNGTAWLSTVSGEGQVHTTSIGAFFVNETYYSTNGQGTRKRANLDQNPSGKAGVQGAQDHPEGTQRLARDYERLPERWQDFTWLYLLLSLLLFRATCSPARS